MTSLDDDKSLEERVILELLDLRKSRFGITAESIAHADIICQLLGAGDHFLAYSRIRHEILNFDFGMPIMAAAASLGLTAEGEGHLNRLTVFGSEMYLDQRQVRRYCDKGIHELATMIVTNWPTETSPEITLAVSKDSERFEIQIFGSYLHIIKMKDPLVTVLADEVATTQKVVWIFRESENLDHFSATEPVIIKRSQKEISVVVIWRGELWPKFNIAWMGVFENCLTESLGNKVLILLQSGAANN